MSTLGTVSGMGTAARRPSFLFLSAAARLTAAGGVASLVWIGVAWALRV